MKDCFGLHGHYAFGSVAKEKSGVGRKSATSVGLTTDLVHWLQAGKYQVGEPGCGRNPGLMRNCLSESVPAGECSMIEFTLPDSVPALEMKQLHLRYLLLDTKTGYRSQSHSLAAIMTL